MSNPETELKPTNPAPSVAGEGLGASTVRSFEIRTLSDIFNLPTMEQMETCLTEISAGMIQARATKDLLGCLAENIGCKLDVEWPEVTIWSDDGKGEVSTSFTNKENPKDTIAVVSKPNDQGQTRSEAELSAPPCSQLFQPQQKETK